MRLFCRDDHDEVEDRCPPHQFVGALWDDVGTSTTLSVMFCQWCAEVRPLAVPSIGPSELETVAADSADILEEVE